MLPCDQYHSMVLKQPLLVLLIHLVLDARNHSLFLSKCLNNIHSIPCTKIKNISIELVWFFLMETELISIFYFFQIEFIPDFQLNGRWLDCGSYHWSSSLVTALSLVDPFALNLVLMVLWLDLCDAHLSYFQRQISQLNRQCFALRLVGRHLYFDDVFSQLLLVDRYLVFGDVQHIYKSMLDNCPSNNPHEMYTVNVTILFTIDILKFTIGIYSCKIQRNIKPRIPNTKYTNNQLICYSHIDQDLCIAFYPVHCKMVTNPIKAKCRNVTWSV